LTALVALCVLPACAPTLRQTPLNSGDIEREAEKQKDAAFATWTKRQERLDGIAVRLSEASADLCPSKRPAIGLALHNVSTYKGEYKASAARYFNLGDAMTVRSVQPNFPAARAGVVAGDALLGINGKSVDGMTVQQALDILKDAAAGKDSVRLSMHRDGRTRDIALLPTVICAYPATVTQDDIVNAYADGRQVYIASGMMRFAETDDELALVVAHEMAHNALGHVNKTRGNAFLGALIDVAIAAGTGVNTQGVFSNAAAHVFSQEFESEADYEGLYMAARAGFNISNAPEFWRRMAAEHPGSIKKNFAASHPSTPQRFLALENAVKEIEVKRQRGDLLLPEGSKGTGK
jgi:hypothetical protein